MSDSEDTLDTSSKPENIHIDIHVFVPSYIRKELDDKTASIFSKFIQDLILKTTKDLYNKIDKKIKEIEE